MLDHPSVPVIYVAKRLSHHLEMNTRNYEVPYPPFLTYLFGLPGRVEALEDWGWTEYVRFIEEDCIRDCVRFFGFS